MTVGAVVAQRDLSVPGPIAPAGSALSAGASFPYTMTSTDELLLTLVARVDPTSDAGYIFGTLQLEYSNDNEATYTPIQGVDFAFVASATPNPGVLAPQEYTATIVTKLLDPGSAVGGLLWFRARVVNNVVSNVSIEVLDAASLGIVQGKAA